MIANKKLIVTILIFSGLIASRIILAHDDFDAANDIVSPSTDKQSVTIPGQGNNLTDILYQQYKSSLNDAISQGDPDMADRLAEQAKATPTSTLTPSPITSTGAAELPFTLLNQTLDSDQDGLSNEDEIRLKTDPHNPDTDADTYLDGLEVVRGYNPKQAAPGDKIKYQKPNNNLPSQQYKITGLRLTGVSRNQLLTITGTGPNNSLVALLILSDENKLWITRTDTTGRFLYTSADTLTPGSYTAYAIAVSVNGDITAASAPLAFIREENKLIKVNSHPTSQPVASSSADTNILFNKVTIFLAAAIPAIAIGLVTFLVLLWQRNRRKKNSSADPSLLT